MSRVVSFIYGIICYFVFFVVFLYMIAFIGDIWVPKTVSTAGQQDATIAIIINIALMALFGIQHSVMARDKFKKWITGMIPKHIERSTYVLASSLALVILMYFWQPLNGVLWHMESSMLITMMYTLFAIGWALVLLSTFLTNHFDLFGLRQVYLNLAKKTYTQVKFTERLFYKWIRHPMMLGLLIGFWAIPIMTMNHLLFSVGMSIYVFIGIHYEEKSLAKHLGIEYQQYLNRTNQLFPHFGAR